MRNKGTKFPNENRSFHQRPIQATEHFVPFHRDSQVWGIIAPILSVKQKSNIGVHKLVTLGRYDKREGFS